MIVSYPTMALTATVKTFIGGYFHIIPPTTYSWNPWKKYKCRFPEEIRNVLPPTNAAEAEDLIVHENFIELMLDLKEGAKLRRMIPVTHLPSSYSLVNWDNTTCLMLLQTKPGESWHGLNQYL